MMACNSRDCAGIFSVKRGQKGLLDRNDGLHFKGLYWGFQCEKGVKGTSGQNSWPAIHGAVMELFSVKGEIKLIGWNNFIAGKYYLPCLCPNWPSTYLRFILTPGRVTVLR